MDDSDAVWSKLSATEQREFLDLAAEGKTNDLIPPWEAWWEGNYTVASEGNKAVPAFVEACPPLFDCPPLSQVMVSGAVAKTFHFGRRIGG